MATRVTIVDAFTERPFSGNPAAVCVMTDPAPELWMQSVAAELNLPMTAFVVPRTDGDLDLRWFTPQVEVSICGHATLAAAHVLGGRPRFHTKSGLLTAAAAPRGTIEMDFPAIAVTEDEDVAAAARFVRMPAEAVRGSGSGGEWCLVELADVAAVRSLHPDLDAVRAHGGVVVAVAVPGEAGFDTACRVFEPASGLDEDPATGSAHCVIAPWLSQRTGRSTFRHQQVSSRGGVVETSVEGDRVLLRGAAVTILEGDLHIS